MVLPEDRIEEFEVQLDWKGTVDEHLLYLRSENYTDGTLKTHRSHLGMLQDFCQANGVNSPKNVSKKLIRSFMLQLKDSGKAATYCNRILSSIRGYYNFLVEEGYIEYTDNPVLGIKFQKTVKKVIPTFSNEEIINMLKVAESFPNKYASVRNKLMIMIMADCGLRVNELNTLADADVTAERIHIKNGKGQKERIVYVTSPVARQIMKYRRIRNSYFADKQVFNVEGLFFLNFKGQKIRNDGVQKMLKKVAEKAGVREEIRVSPHTLRHWFAQSQLKNGISIYTLSKLLGHTDIATTQVYLRSISDEELIESAIKTSPLLNLK